MRKLLIVMAVLAFVAMPANAALRLFFDDPAGGGDPDIDNPYIMGPVAGYALDLWAESINYTTQEHWNSVAFNINGTPGVTVDSYTIHNTNIFGTNRWQSTVYNGPALPDPYAYDFRLFYVSAGFGVTDQYGSIGFDPEYRVTPSGYAIRLATMTFSGAGDVFIEVGLGGIVLSGQPVQSVYMGVGDEDAGLMGDSFDMTGYLADATFTPEPASLLLLGLGALVLRRR